MTTSTQIPKSEPGSGYNGSSPRGAGNTASGLTHPLDLTKEGLVPDHTRSALLSDETACFVRQLDLVNVEVIARFTIDGDPTSKARARFTNYRSPGRMYTPEKTRAAEEHVAWQFKRAAPTHVPDKDRAYGLACIFFPATHQRRDVDNMLKLISDGLNGIAFDDDSQVYEVTGRRGPATPENARTEVLVYRMGFINGLSNCVVCGKRFKTYPSINQQTCSKKCGKVAIGHGTRECTCAHCGKVFEVARSDHKRKYCNESCRSLASHVLLTCEVCGDEFDCWRSWQRKHAYCDKPECRNAVEARIHRERRSGRFPGTCLVCGAGTTRKEYKRCNPCKRANKAIPS